MSIAVDDYTPVRLPARAAVRAPEAPLRSQPRNSRPRRPAPVRPYTRPAAGSVEHRSHRVRVPAGAHPLPVESPARKVSASIVLCAALLTAVVVMGLLGLAHLRAPAAPAVSGPTTVVQVRDGESLSDVAARVAPGSSRASVVDSIRQLNDLSDSGLHPGQTLVAPIGN